jgi:hypothetical protein
VTTLCRIPHKSFSHLKKKKASNFFGAPALSRAPAGMATMQFDLDLVFPIRDPASAELMMLKAACLCNAGVIDARQREIVERRARRFLEQNVFQHSSAACARTDAFMLRKRRTRGAMRTAA